MAQKIVLPQLMWYQKPVVEALEDSKTKYVIFLASRRIGKSLVAKCMAIRWALGERCNVGFIVPTGDLARRFIKEICEILQGSGAITGSNSVDKFIQFANGSLLYFHSAEAFSRGAGNYKFLIADEMAFLDTDTWNAVFRPWELEAKKVYFCSTPCGVGGVFYDMYHKGKTGNRRYKSFECNLEEAGLYDQTTINEIKESTPERLYSQEYMCQFLAGGISCFPNYESRLVKHPSETTKDLYAGIDFSGASGEGKDSTVLSIVNNRGEIVMQKTYGFGNTATLQDMANTLKVMGVKMTFAESNAMGAISIEIMKQIYKPIAPFTTTNETKRDIIENVIRMFERGEGAIFDTPQTRVQFGNFVQDYTRNKKITYHNLKDSIHDDIVISYCLACWCQKQYARKGHYVIS